MITLNTSQVTFLPDEHQYFNSSWEELSGITSMLKRQLFPEKYKGVSSETLEAAAQYGNGVHENIEYTDTFNPESKTKEAEEYIALRGEYIPVANEYLVSNDESHATCIDCVWQLPDNDEHIALVDIKTTYELDIPYVTWQLSINAYLFELQNPHLKVTKLYAVWLPKNKSKKPQLVNIERIPSFECELLLSCDKNGIQYTETEATLAITNPVHPIPEAYQEMETQLVQILKEQKRYEAIAKEIKSKLTELLVSHNIKRMKSDNATYTLKEAYTKEVFDSARFKEDHPLLYDMYVKQSQVKDSILIKTK